MHRVFRLKTFTPVCNVNVTPKVKTSMLPFTNDVAFASLTELFASPNKIIEQIDAKDRTNLYYTLYHTSYTPEAAKARAFVEQDVLAFDCDKMLISHDGSYDPKYITTFFKVTGLDPERTVVVFSGNGLHFIAKGLDKITSADYFKSNKKLYVLTCTRLTQALKAEGLQGEFDPAIFDPQRVLRLPGSWNEKPGKPRRLCSIVSGLLLPQEVELRALAGGEARKAPKNKSKPLFDEAGEPKTVAKESSKEDPIDIPDKAIKRLKFDQPAVLDGCAFLKHVKENQAKISEPQWHAAISILAKLPDGEKLTHAYSSGHPSYSAGEAQAKFEFATKSGAGPRTCENISTLWDGCAVCPHYNKISSPLFIESEDHISSAENGFMLVGKRGALIPDYVGLRKQFFRDKKYCTDIKTGEIYVYNGKYFKVLDEKEISAYAHERFVPEQMNRVHEEWIGRLQRENLINSDIFNVPGYINFSNGVLEVSTGKLLPHSVDLKFLNVLPYDYSPDATCPEFDSMMKRVTLNRSDIEQTLLEFTGYGVCERDYWLEKCLLLVGEGANGKSTFLEVVKNLAGKDNYSICSMGQLSDKIYRHTLKGMLCNVSEEMPNKKLYDSDIFKKLFGGEIDYRLPYKPFGSFTCTTKLFFACNQLQESADLSEGYFRRIVIVPFDANFKDEERDYTLKAKLKAETPGIFNRVYAAWKDLKKRGHLFQADAVKEEMHEYRQVTDTVGTWFKEAVDVTNSTVGGEKLSFTVLFNAFKNYQHEIGDRENFTRNRFSTHLKRCLPDYKSRKCLLHGISNLKGLKWKDNRAGGYVNGHDTAPPLGDRSEAGLEL